MSDSENRRAPLDPAGTNGRSRQKTPLVFAACALLLYPMDYLFLGYLSGWTLAIRVVWATSLAVSGLVIDRLSESWVRPLVAVNGILSSLLFLGIVHFTGGVHSPNIHIVPTLPLIVALFDPRDSTAAILTGITSALGVLMMQLVEHNHLSQAMAWSSMVAITTFFGVYGSRQFRRMEEAQQQADLERARREALEKLTFLERHRAQSEKLATIGRLAASVMHEINNPIAFIRANLDYLQHQLGTQPLQRREDIEEVLQETRTGVERIRQIAADLKGFSRMDAEEPSECSLSHVVMDAAQLASLRLKHVARLQVEVPENLPEVFATRRRLAQVILNLLVNAGDALEESHPQDAEVRVRGLVEGSRVVLLIEDNGPGFAPDALPRVFEAFFTTKDPEKGTGLGLAISRELVEQFGGSLIAENRAEGGARLRIELPLHRPLSRALPQA